MHKGCALAWAGWVRETMQFPEAFLVYQVMHFQRRLDCLLQMR